MKKSSKACSKKRKELTQFEDALKYIGAKDFLILFYNVLKARDNPLIAGFLHADLSYEYFEKRLDRAMSIRRSILECCLWSANMLDEHGKFWHPEKKTFNEFLKKLLQGDTFDKRYNLIFETVKERRTKPPSVFDYVNDLDYD